MAPLAMQEMVLAVWLITKGFAQAVMAAEPAAEKSRWQAATPSTISAT